jgi:hypothetical protein
VLASEETDNDSRYDWFHEIDRLGSGRSTLSASRALAADTAAPVVQVDRGRSGLFARRLSCPERLIGLFLSPSAMARFADELPQPH